MSSAPSFAGLLRRHRRTARLTLEQLAEASGVSARTLSDMERGRSKGPQHRTVLAVADALALDEVDRKQLIELARDGRLRDHWARATGLCELPRTVDDFTGRAAELVWTKSLVPTDEQAGSVSAGLITGPAGLGKTTFAIRAGHALQPDFPDGVFFLDLLGMSPQPMPGGHALLQLLRALGIPDQQIPAAVQERASLYRSMLRDRRVLVVLDNAASEEQVRPLLPGGGLGRALVTSRRLLAGLEGVRRLHLGPLPLLEATLLLSGIVGERGAPDGADAMTELAQLCGGLPLALRIIGNRLVSRPGWGAAELAARLADEEHRLDQLKAGDLKIANAFGMSYEQLAPSARRVFRRLALIPGTDFDPALAAVAGELSITDAWDALDELIDLGLLQDGAHGRYRFHDLVRLFARGRLSAEESTAQQTSITQATSLWLLRTATTAGRWFEPGYGRPQEPAPDLPTLSSLDEADRWLRVNVDNWMGALRQMANAGLHAAVLDCAESMHWFSDRWIHGPHWRDVFTLGAQAAEAIGDMAQQATQLNYLAWVLGVPMQEPEAALQRAAQALDLAVRSGATLQIGWSHQYTAIALRLLGRFDEAIMSAYRGAEVFNSLADPDAMYAGTTNLGHCLRDAGRHDEALEQLRRALALVSDPESKMTRSIAAYLRPHTLRLVGQCLALLGRRTEAIRTLTQATELLDGLDSNQLQAQAWEALAALLAQEGPTDESRRAYARAAQVFEAVGDAEAHTRCHTLGSATQ